MEYSESQVEEAIHKVYAKRGNDGYAAMKTESFLSRCHRFDRRSNGDDITLDAIESICFAALDQEAECELRANLR